MSQIFPRSANALARSSLFGVLSLVLFLGWLVLTLMRSSWATKQNEFVEQPIQFSHAHHAGGMGIDCRYCHTTVEKSASAGMPSTQICLSCHAVLFRDAPALAPLHASAETGVPIAWNRVYDLPDFVYFNHSIHVAKGVGCVSCHGRVDRMPLMRRAVSLSMRWCLACHRAPQQFLRPRDKVFDLAWQPADQDRLGMALMRRYAIHASRLTDCSVCHR